MDSISFDLDGTLWDSRKAVVMAWNHVLTERGELDSLLSINDLKIVNQ